ncbi:glycosyltransferase family 4 protein [Evansella sp. AB-P1]|uniref:glycosyltransferase family 4 protein n=1 Tax=Evansella sp. AB-P1 TaxID=3037653 RepID=UPI00241C1AE4|nr:glycosyltransferase family 4 protein [Evansella sp. AB-P1]MDG5788956.1 glycosyltransferase family 4 protein [Evansella sp. AB-P1]
MKIVLATPNYDQIRGNTVTVDRIGKGLNKVGVHTEIVSSTDRSNYNKDLVADIFHGFHAFRFYTFMKHSVSDLKPYVLTLTGTDLNYDLYDNKRREAVIQTLAEAEAIHVFNEEGREKLLTEIPYFKEKTFVIQQGVSPFARIAPPIRKEEGTFLFVLPAGIRSIKNIPGAINMLSKVQEKLSTIRLWIVGPILDEGEGETVKALIEKKQNWIRYLGHVPHDRMGGIYDQGDVLLNTSFAEGQSSAILEGMLSRLPALIYDNEGNRSIVKHGETGFLYRNESEFIYLVNYLFESPHIRKKIGEAGQSYVLKNHSSNKEVEKLLSIYERVLGTRI